ncbi:MAG: glutamate--tRNA ligase [Parcubacteria group bacterium]|nr:glutamate--tRNA ligase [Parcubacteria group bacterium]
MKIKTRIAPSPTGLFHIGNARTALFSYLFAKKNHGEFLLRIEDTDIERSKKEYEDDIINGLRWLGIIWDGEIIRQRDRAPKHREYLEKLLAESKAFYCRHTPAELAQEQKNQELEKIPFRHDCQHKYDPEISDGVIRLKNPGGKIVFKDLIRGELIFESELLGDLVLAKDLNTPLYNFAVVIDDAEMEITHVIRGDDHLSNTPKQILTQEALGFNRPEYAHLPLILAADRSKLSKRHGGTSVTEYKNMGYLPQALLNFMALLGWHPATDQEIFSLEELIQEFDLNRVQKAGAVFDKEKLDSINRHYIKQLVPAELAKHIAPHFIAYNLNPEQLIKTAHLFQDRLNRFSEIKDLAGFLFDAPKYQPELLNWKNSSAGETKSNLETALMVLEKLPIDSFNIDTITTELMPVANKIGRGEVLWPLRVALSGLDKSPSPFEIMEVLGKAESVARIKKAIDKIK